MGNPSEEANCVARKRLSRKELTEKDDITTSLERATTFVVENGKAVLTVVGVVVAVVIVLVSWSVYTTRVETSAQIALAGVITTYSNLTNEDDDARFSATIAAALLVQREYQGTQAADIAVYYAALGQEGLGNTSESDQMFRGLVESGDETIRDIARFALAESYKKRDDLEAAIIEYQALADSPDYSRGAILYELGRLLEAVSRPEEAQGYYEALVAEYPDSPFRTEVDRALRRLRSATEGSPS